MAIHGFAIRGVSEGGRTVVVTAALLSLVISLVIYRVRIRQKARCALVVPPAGGEEKGRIAPAPRHDTGDLCASLLAGGPPTGRFPEPAAVELAYGRADDGSPQAHWLDAIPLPGARVALVAGSVTEDGEPAPTLMPELRAAVRTPADIDMQPDDTLTHLQDVLHRLQPDEAAHDVAASCLYAVYDPVTADCTLASAGHPAPIVISPEGVPIAVDLPSGTPLGHAREHMSRPRRSGSAKAACSCCTRTP